MSEQAATAAAGDGNGGFAIAIATLKLPTSWITNINHIFMIRYDIILPLISIIVIVIILVLCVLLEI